jgi:fructan beta-fructosidase
MKGWTFEGDFLHWAGAFTRMNFGNSGTPFIGTAEDGSGGYDDNFTGTITSPPFKVTGSNIELLVGGGAGPGEYVELIDETGKQLFAEHGQNRETMDKRTWNVANLKGKVLRIRIVDSEKEGWGHINVGQIRCTG